LEGRPEVVLAYLFGSAARGTASGGSDLDVAVSLLEPPRDPLSSRARLAEALMRAAGGTRVDVVLLGDAPPALAGRIVRTGTVLVCRDESHRVRLEVAILRREFDTKPIREALDRAQSSAIRAGRFYG
jgi:hypothetical protein